MVSVYHMLHSSKPGNWRHPTPMDLWIHSRQRPPRWTWQMLDNEGFKLAMKDGMDFGRRRWGISQAGKMKGKTSRHYGKARVARDRTVTCDKHRKSTTKPFWSQTCTCTTTSQDKMYMCVLSQTASYSQATRCRPLLSRANTSNNRVYTVHSSQDHSRERLFSGNTFKDVLIYICALKYPSYIWTNTGMCGYACSMARVQVTEWRVWTGSLLLPCGLKHGPQGLRLGSKRPNLLSCVTCT